MTESIERAAVDETERTMHRNDVHLVGRLSARVVVRELPSRDLRATWRLVVRRPARGEDQTGSRPSMDAVDCGTWSPTLLSEAQTWESGDQIEIHGALRRRFWRTGGALHSRYEVEATSARRLAGVAHTVSSAAEPPVP